MHNINDAHCDTNTITIKMCRIFFSNPLEMDHLIVWGGEAGFDNFYLAFALFCVLLLFFHDRLSSSWFVEHFGLVRLRVFPIWGLARISFVFARPLPPIKYPMTGPCVISARRYEVFFLRCQSCELKNRSFHFFNVCVDIVEMKNFSLRNDKFV